MPFFSPLAISAYNRLRGVSTGGIPTPFAPSDIAGLKLWLDADAANVNTEAAAFFPSTARQDLSSTSTEFDFNGSSFSVCGWVNRPAGGTLAYHFTKSTGSTNQRAINISTNASGFVRMFISNNGTGFTSTVTSTTALVNLNTWYFISCVFDFDNSTSKITVNGGTDFEDTASETNVFSSNAPVLFNAINEGVGFKSQKLDLFCVYSKALSIGEINAIYNSGNATAYADLSAAQKTGLVSWWSLSETNGTRYDQHGTNNLTDFGNVTWAAGVLDEPVVNNSPVSLWIDKSTATNNATQTTAINQPIWLSPTPSVDFDFTTNSQFLEMDGLVSDLAATTTGTWCGWFRFVDATPTTQMALWAFGDTDVSSYIYCYLNTDGTFVFKSRIDSSTQWQLATTNPITTDNTWVHIAVIQDGVSPVIKINNVVVAQSFSVVSNKAAWFANDLDIDNGRIGIISVSNVDVLPLIGEVQQGQIYNSNLSTDDLTSIYNYNQPTGSEFIIATGGTETTVGDFKIHSFTAGSGIFEVRELGTDSTYGSSIEYLIVAGGAGGGGGSGGTGGGGAGAGGMLESTSQTIVRQPYAITVGAGGAFGAHNQVGSNGSNSSIGGIATATGGGGGGTYGSANGLTGGSGGGGASNSGGAGAGVSGQGLAGGTGMPAGMPWYGGGGGGKSTVGTSTNPSTLGVGGAGKSNSITGAATYYSGGGGGGINPAGSGASGGIGGGGTGAGGGVSGTDGATNTGGGGGGGRGGGAFNPAGNGGSGIVIIKYKFQ